MVTGSIPVAPIGRKSFCQTLFSVPVRWTSCTSRWPAGSSVGSSTKPSRLMCGPPCSTQSTCGACPGRLVRSCPAAHRVRRPRAGRLHARPPAGPRLPEGRTGRPRVLVRPRADRDDPFGVMEQAASRQDAERSQDGRPGLACQFPITGKEKRATGKHRRLSDSPGSRPDIPGRELGFNGRASRRSRGRRRLRRNMLRRFRLSS